jgi:hypothetical protein
MVFTKTGPLNLGSVGTSPLEWKLFLQLSGFGLKWKALSSCWARDLVSVPNRREKLSWKGKTHKKKNCTEWLSFNLFGGQIMVRKWEIPSPLSPGLLTSCWLDQDWSWWLPKFNRIFSKEISQFLRPRISRCFTEILTNRNSNLGQSWESWLISWSGHNGLLNFHG